MKAEEFERIWPLSGVSIEPPATGRRAGSIVGVVRANEGVFVCKLAGPWKTPAALAAELQAFDLLPRLGFLHLPRLLKTSAGADFNTAYGRTVYLIEYVEGHSPVPTAATYARLGQLTAELHLVRGYPYRTELHPGRLIAEDLPARASSLPFKIEYLSLARLLPSFDGLPEAVIHTDIAPTNAIETGDGRLTFIDWDGVGVGPRVLDVGFPLIQQFVSEDRVFEVETARSFYQAYGSLIELTGLEMQHIFPAALLLALRYITYGDLEKRWNRILWAIENREFLEETVQEALAVGR